MNTASDELTTTASGGAGVAIREPAPPAEPVRVDLLDRVEARHRHARRAFNGGDLGRQVTGRARVRRYETTKRVIDLTCCLVALPVVLPLLLLVTVAIRLDSPGPIAFSQLRTGKDGRRFRMYKFRTMVRDAEDLKESLQHLNVLPPPDFKIPDDPRTTRVGRFLRATSLDELPQILNVLKGDMSLVGPRPTSFAPETYDTWHTVRLEVTPGITGLWQIKGRNNSTFDERLRLDVAYVRNRSIPFDLWIIWRTTASVLHREGT